MRHVSSTYLFDVCLVIGLFSCAEGMFAQGLTSATPAKEYIYLGSQLIAIEMAPSSAGSSAALASQSQKRTESAPMQPHEIPSYPIESKLPLQQKYSSSLAQAIANDLAGMTGKEGAK